MKRTVLFLLLMGIGLVNAAPTWAQSPTDYKYHSVFIYNFTKYIQWPTSAQSGDFVIGVLGSSGIIPELEKMAASKTVGSQKIIVRRFNSVSEISNCHILFIPATGSASLEAVKAKMKGRPTLTITEKTGLAKLGSCINFVVQDNKWKFELNETATGSAGLKVARELAGLAIKV